MSYDIRMTSLDSWEQKFARLLAEALADEDWWASAATFPSDSDWRSKTAARAVELYRVTSIVVQECLEEDVVSPTARAAGALREIADACALLSQTWTPEERADLHVPTRPLIELIIRLDDLERWTQAAGHPLTLVEGGSTPEEAWPGGEHFSDMSRDELARQFTRRASLYGRLLDIREESDAGDLFQSVDFRKGACLELGWSRSCLVWVRSHLDVELESIGAAMVFMAQASFVMSRELGTDEPLFPTKDHLRRLLGRTDAHVWLLDQGSELPDWLEP